MKINFNQELKTIEGGTLMRNKAEGDTIVTLPATLKWACVEACLATSNEASKLSGEEKAGRYDLALRIQNAEEPLDLSVAEIAKLAKLCDENFAPLIVGQTRRLLDPKSD